MISKALLKAWENHSGFDYGEVGHPDFEQFKAGWIACHEFLNLLWDSIPDDFRHDRMPYIKTAEPWINYKRRVK